MILSKRILQEKTIMRGYCPPYACAAGKGIHEKDFIAKKGGLMVIFIKYQSVVKLSAQRKGLQNIWRYFPGNAFRHREQP